MISKKRVRIVSSSDHHNGGRRTTTRHILDNLTTYLFPELTEEVDICAFAGDFFDRLLQTSSEDIGEILYWIVTLLCICKKNNIIVRVLEGTPGHDFKQGKLFVTVNAMLGNIVDLKYVPILSIERIESLGLDVLYVPDRWSDHGDITYKQVLDLLAVNGLEKVDIAIMHGAFEYQMPKNHETHVEQRYLDIVRYFIFIGHVHEYSVYERIISHGSFDRTGHGYESPKGFVVADLFDDGTCEHRFVENKNAKLYLAFDVTDKSFEEIQSFFLNQSWPNDTYILLRISADHAAAGMIKSLSANYPQWNFKRDIVSTSSSAKLKPDSVLPPSAHISKVNIMEILLDRMRDFTPDKLSKASAIIAEIA